MADLNDFKVLKNKCVKMFDFLGLNNISDENERARLGFYHIVLESIAGILDLDEAKESIIDTSYNKKVLDISVDDLGIDAVYFRNDYVEGEKPIYLFNFKYRNNFVEAATPDTDISRSLKFIEYLDLNTSIQSIPHSIGKKVRDKIIAIRKKLESNDSYRIYLYMVSNQLGNFASNSFDHIRILMNNYGIKIINLSLDDLTKYIFDARNAIESRFMISKDDFLSFDGDSKSTKKSFVVKMSLVDIVRILSSNETLSSQYNLEDDTDIINSKLNMSLLYDNVRGYLEETGFNKNIKETLRSNHKCFFMFNNGVTITAEEIVSEPKNSNEKYLFTLKNFQIVNGGQTIRTIFSYLNDIESERLEFNYRNTYILVRLFKIESDDRLKNEIAEYTNSQNQISAYDLKSVDSIQIQIENYLKEYNILYVRKVGNVGEYSVDYKHRISKEELAQIIHSIQGYPDRVTNVKIKLFTDYYNQIFPIDNFPFEKIVAYIDDYFLIKQQYRQKNKRKYNESIKSFYVMFIINNYNILMEDAISILDDFIRRYKQRKDISIPRYLIQKNTKELLIQELETKMSNTR